MQADFSRTLSLLRQEKKISQKNAAACLGVSQALLSHYENGVREPGLSFVARASEFYGVSCDYLLGRSMTRTQNAINPESLIDVSAQKDNVLRGSAFAMLNKKLIVNSVALILDVLASCPNRQIVTEVSAYLSTAVYKIFRFVYNLDTDNKQDEFPVPADVFSEMCDVELKKHELKMRQLAAENTEMPLSPKKLGEDFPTLAPSLFSLLHNVSDKISK